MDGWPREGTGWNPKFAQKYEIVAETVVCNQLSEQAQHLWGKQYLPGHPRRGELVPRQGK